VDVVSWTVMAFMGQVDGLNGVVESQVAAVEDWSCLMGEK
jgi:hypothetical protein